jgi:hypothetical protein
MYAEAIRSPDEFWGKIGRRIDWLKPYTRVKDVSFAAEDFHIRWFYDGTLNVSANCLDRHLEQRGDKTAIIWESDDPALSERLSYRELYERVCQCANALKALGVRKGDRVTICSPARGSAPCTRWCSRDSRPKRSRDASPIADRRTSSRRTKACAAASASPSKRASTKH